MSGDESEVMIFSFFNSWSAHDISGTPRPPSDMWNLINGLGLPLLRANSVPI